MKTGMRVDNRLQRDMGQIEEKGDFTFTGEGIALGFSAAVRGKEEQAESEIYQLFVKKELASPKYSLKAGRYERVDAGGHYLIDGAGINMEFKSFSMEAYGGGYMRMEDFLPIGEVIKVGGFDVEYPGYGEDTFNGKFGYQKAIDGKMEDSVSWSASEMGMDENNGGINYEFIAQGKMLIQGKRLESCLIEAKSGNPEEQVILGYEIYNLEIKSQSLKNSFYRLYGVGHEESVKGAVNLKLSDILAFHGSGRSISRVSWKGYAGGMGAGIKNEDVSLTFDAEYLNLNGEQSLALFVSSENAVSPMVTAKLTLLVQKDETKTNGINHGKGLETFIEAMAGRQLYVSFSAMYVDNSSLRDEYMAGLSVRKSFNYAVWEQ